MYGICIIQNFPLYGMSSYSGTLPSDLSKLGPIRAGGGKEGMVRPNCEKMARAQIFKTLLFCIIRQLTLMIQASDHFSFLNSFDKWLRLTTGKR